ncbi:MAG: type II toxin-antitoxin system VapC family toxin [Candidatus Solibacter usitatus]|nr:type II toxin-antitoxin system VapC family toxin [Candidatus Solibacter usitatus]
MTVLLDTHVFLWAISEQNGKLSRKARQLIEQPSNRLLLSAASLCKITLKIQAGKLRMPAAKEFFIAEMLHLNVETMAIVAAHVLDTLTLPAHHVDPFDRILVAQSRVEQIPLLTADPLVRKYPVETIW